MADGLPSARRDLIGSRLTQGLLVVALDCLVIERDAPGNLLANLTNAGPSILQA